MLLKTIFFEQNVRECLYREKDVGGGLCHGHISHLVHPKTLILERLDHAKKSPKNLANNLSDALAILNCFLSADAVNFFS